MTDDLGRGYGTRESNEEITASENTGNEALLGAQDAAELVGQAAISISQPAPGQNVSIQAEAGQRYVIEFEPDAAQVRVQGNDLILLFSNGATVTFENLVQVASEADAPVFEIGGQQLASSEIFGPIITSAPPTPGTGETRYDDDTGEIIDLLDPQGVIPPTELQFGLIALEPTEVLLGVETNPPVDFDVDVTAGFVDSLAAAGLTFAPGVGFGFGGGAVAAVSAVGGSGTGGAIFVTGHDSEEHSNGEYMSAGLDFLAFGHEATGGEIAQRGSFTVAFLNPNTDNGAVSAMQAQGWNVTFFDLDNDFSPAFNGSFDLIMVGSGDGSSAHRDALFNAESNFEAFINGGGGLYINTDEGFGQTWYDFVPNFGTATNNTISDSGVFTTTSAGLAIGLTEAIVDADITHSFYTGVNTDLFTVFEVTDESFGEDAGIPVAFGTRNIGISDGEFVRADTSTGGLLYEFQVGEAEIVADNIHGTDVEDGVTTSFVITNLPTGPDGAPVGFLLIDRGDDNVIEEIVGPGFSGVPINVQTGDSVWYFLPKSDFADRPDVVTFNYFTTDSDGLTSLNDGPATVTINLPDPVPTVSATDSAVDEDDIPFTDSNQPPGSDIHNLGDPPFDPDAGQSPPDGFQPTIVDGTITANFSFDEPGTIGFTQGTIDGLNALGLTSSTNDLPLSYAISNGGRTLTATAGSETVFEVTLSPGSSSGNFDYAFELIGSINHPLTDDPATGDVETKFEDPSVLPIQFQVTDLNGDSATGVFNVSIVDDVPTIGFDGAEGQYGDGVLPGSVKLWEADIHLDGAEGVVIPATAVQHFTVVYGADGPESDSSVAPALALNFLGARAPAEGPGTETEIVYDTDGTTADPALTSGGETVTVTGDAGDPRTILGFIDRDGSGTFNDGDDLVFTGQVQLSGGDPRDGQLVFELHRQLDHPDNDDPSTPDINESEFTLSDGTTVRGLDNIQFEFSVTVTDDDGDSDTLNFTVDVDDDGPQVFQTQAAIVDEDGLDARPVGTDPQINEGIPGGPGDIPDPQPGDDGNEATFVGSLNVDFGTDKPGDIDFAGLDGEPVVDASGVPVLSHGLPLTYSWDASTHTLSAVTPGGPGDGTDGSTGLPGPSGNNLVTGLGGPAGFGENTFAPNDDGSVEVDITSIFGPGGMNFFGTSFTSIFINNNGNITFDSSQSTFTPFAITGSTGNPIIAPYFADVDTRASGEPIVFDPAGNSTGTDLVYWDMDTVNGIMTITWDDVGFFSSDTSKTNAFQLRIFDNGGGDFSFEFRYEDINWTTGDASSGTDGLGGVISRAGWSSGDGVNFFELPQSGDQAQMLALEDMGSNVGVPGVWQFGVVEGGVVDVPTGAGETIFELEITDVQNGDYTLTLLNQVDHPLTDDPATTEVETAFEDDILLDLPFTVTDFDGDTATGILPVQINDDSPLVGPEQMSIAVDEDGLEPDGIAGGPGDIVVPDTDLDGNEATNSGVLDYDFGADGPGDVDFAALDGMPVMDENDDPVLSRGEQVVYRWDGDTHTLFGEVPAAPGGGGRELVQVETEPRAVFELQITDINTGAYTFALLDVLDHPLPLQGGPAVEDDIVLKLPFTVTDFDGDAATGNLFVNVNDDSPVIDGGEGMSVQEAEIVDTDGTTVTFAFGADGPDAVTPVALTFGPPAIDVAETPGELPETAIALTSDGLPVTVVAVDATTLRGFVTLPGDSDVAEKDIFTATVDPDTGEFVFTLLGPIDHPDLNQAGTDDQVRLLFDVTVKDGDGDTATQRVSVTVDDDQPALENVTLTHDETPGIDNPDDVDPASKSDGLQAALNGLFGEGGAPTELGVAQKGFDFDYGADGPGRLIGLDPITDGTDSGLLYSATNDPILLFNGPDGSVVGVVIPAGFVLTGQSLDLLISEFELPVAFVAFMEPTAEASGLPNNASSADLWFVQYLAVEHDNPADHDEAGPEGGEFANELFALDFSVEDRDGDTVTRTATITIEDDGPRLNDATVMGTVEEEHLPGGNEDTFPAADGDTAVTPPGSDVTTTIATGSLAPLVNFGADTPGTFSLSADLSGLPALTSNGETVLYGFITNVLVGFVDVDDPVGDSREGVFDSDDRLVFSLHLNPNGSYIFELRDQLDHPLTDDPDTPVTETAFEDILGIDFSSIVVATDADGDTTGLDAGAFTIDVIDDVPRAREDGFTVDEDGLAGGNPGGPGDTALAVTMPVHSLFGPEGGFGADGPGDIDFASLDGTTAEALSGATTVPLTSSGDAITYDWDGATHTLTAVADLGGADERPVFTLQVTNLNAGIVTFKLLDAVDHPLTDDPGTGTVETAFEDDLRLNLPFSVTDFDGDASTHTLQVVIDDDSPIIDGAEGSTVTHDETPGIDLDADDTANPRPTALAAAILALGLTEIGSAQSNGPVVNVSIGADEPGGLSLTDAAGAFLDGVDSGLDRTSDNLDIFLFTDADDPRLVYGRAGTDATDAEIGETAFLVYLDSTDNSLWVTQFDAVEHPNALDPDDTVSVSDKIFVTATDEDGDAATTDEAVTVAFQDDGPVANDDFDFTALGSSTRGNVITGEDANDPDGSPDLSEADSPGADGVGAIRSIAHDGITYTLNAAGTGFTFAVTGPTSGNTDPNNATFDPLTGELTIETEQGGTLKIDLQDADVGDYVYTAPKGPGAPGGTQTLTFNSLAAGTYDGTDGVVDGTFEVFADGGLVPILVSGINAGLPGSNAAVIFDSANPTGGLTGLGSANEDFGGPGVGTAGAEFGPFPNFKQLEEVLIVSNEGFLTDTINNETGLLSPDGLIDTPFVQGLTTTTIVLDFSSFGSVRLDSIDVLDVGGLINPDDPNSGPQTMTFNLYDAGGALIDTIAATMSGLTTDGDNGFEEVDLLGTVGVVRLEAVIEGSGAVDNIVFAPPGGEDETEVFDYVLEDGDGDTAAASLAVLVKAGDSDDLLFGTDGADSFFFSLLADEGDITISNFADGDTLAFTDVVDVGGDPGPDFGEVFVDGSFSTDGSTVNVTLQSGTILAIEDVNSVIETVDDLIANSVIV